jgi:DNA adenine methylase
MVFISGYQNELYDEMLTSKSDWSREVIKATTKGYNGKSFERNEVVWFNEAFINAKARARVPLRLTKIEARNRKTNPERL